MTLEIAPTRAVPRSPGRLLPVAGHTARGGLVPRPRLVRRLTEARDLPLVLIEAPAGYGKTSLLREWAERDGRPVTWLEPAAGDVSPTAELEAAGPAIVIVDDAHRVDPGARLGDAIELASRLPAGCTLALATRRPLAIPAGRLRAHRLVLELGAGDLAMSRMEAALLLDAEGVSLSAEAVDGLTRRTEGWPAVLYLAALALRDEPDAEAAAASFSGADRLVADYLRAELFDALTPAELEFLRRGSLLPRLSGPLCDAVLNRRGSAALLDALSRMDAGVLALDRSGVHFRLHRVIREALHSDLSRFDPGIETNLHRRAAGWHARHGEPEAGLEHALACHDLAAAGRMLWALLPDAATRGNTDGIAGRLRQLGERDRGSEPRLALASALCDLAAGRWTGARRWLDSAERAGAERQTGSELAAAFAAARGCTGRLPARLSAAAPPWDGVARYLQGVGALLAGDLDAARDTLEPLGLDCREAASPATAQVYAQLAALAADADEPERAAEWADRAVAALSAGEDVAPALSALPHAVIAEVAAQRGDLANARSHAVLASRALEQLGDFVPWYVAEAQIWLARAELRLSDARGARELLARAARHVAHVPDAPTLSRWLHATWERADAFAAGTSGDGPALTRAELRVLRFMPSHLSFREIGSRLHVSTNTVKTQAMSVYRKLDVSCRSEAVARGRAVGLIEG